MAPRQRLKDALDAVFAKPINPAHNLDAIECKLFGLGSESYVVGSHEFYLGYAVANDKVLCLDAGHFHPTETIADKLSAVMLYVEDILLHVSRGVRWDSDHVVALNDDLLAIMQEIARSDAMGAGAYRPRFLRRQHQSRRRLGHRHAQCPASALDRPAGAAGRCCVNTKTMAISPGGWRCWKS